MPNHKKIHFTGLAALCWAIWRTRNAVFLIKKNLSSLLMRLFVLLHLLSLTGQVFTSRETNRTWRTEHKH
jgi:hypothetical protein